MLTIHFHQWLSFHTHTHNTKHSTKSSTTLLLIWTIKANRIHAVQRRKLDIYQSVIMSWLNVPVQSHLIVENFSSQYPQSPSVHRAGHSPVRLRSWWEKNSKENGPAKALTQTELEKSVCCMYLADRCVWRTLLWWIGEKEAAGFSGPAWPPRRAALGIQ